jgi:hypothetical protein
VRLYTSCMARSFAGSLRRSHSSARAGGAESFAKMEGVPRVLDDHPDERVGLNDLAAHPQPHCSEPGRMGSRHQEPRRKQVLVALLLGNGGHTLEDAVHALEQSVEVRHVHAQGALVPLRIGEKGREWVVAPRRKSLINYKELSVACQSRPQR